MSSVLTSQAVVLATAMALSGTMILLAAFRLQKSHPTSHFPIPPPCISSDLKKKKREKKKKKKRVRFAEDVVDPSGGGEQFRHSSSSSSSSSFSSIFKKSDSGKSRGMPENRIALYSGIMRDRGVHRWSCSY